MNRFTALVIKHHWVAISLTIIISLLLTTGITRVKINDDLKEMLPKDAESRKVLDELTETFGGTDFMMVIIGNETGTIFNQSTLKKMERISENIESLNGIDKVQSIINLKKVQGQEWGLEVSPFMETVPETQDEMEKLEEDIFADKTYIGSFVSEDKKYAALLVFLTDDTNELEVYEELRKVVKAEETPENIYISGMPVIRSVVANDIKEDMIKLVPFVTIVLVAILYLTIGTWQGVLFTLLVIILSVLPTVGLMGYAQRQFSVLSNAMPVILLALACAYSIHIISRYYREIGKNKPAKEAVANAMKDMNTPVFLAAATTIVGFLSMLTSPMPKLKEFGVLVAFGIFWALILSLTMLPALLTALQPKPKKRKWSILPDNALFGFGKWVVKYKIAVIVVSLLLVIISIIGIRKIKIETNPESFFSEDSEIAKSSKISNNHLGGSNNISIILKGDIKSPQVLNQIIELEKFIESQGEVGTVISIADVIAKINKAINNNDPEYEVIPDTREAVAQALLLYSMSGDPSDFEMFVDYDYSMAHITARFREFDSEKLSRVLKQIREYCVKNLTDIEVKFTGTIVFISETSDMVIRSSINSIIFSIIAVFFISTIAYRSIKYGILCIIPLSVAVILTFGIMGFTGIELSMATAIISCITIGTGVDYAIHCTARYRALKTSRTKGEITSVVVAEVGSPVLFNALSVGMGFAVLLFSNFIPLRFFGGLVFASMIASAFGALTILVAFLDILETKVNKKLRKV